jgi:hypothetical protein
MRYHHNPGLAAINKQLVGILHFAEAIANKTEFGAFDLEADTDAKQHYLELITYKDPSQLTSFVEAKKASIKDEVTRIRSFINL